MEILVIILVVAAVGSLLWRASGFLLGLPAWLLLALMTLSVAVGVPVPVGVLVAAVVLWLASQASTRVRRGHWRSGALRGLSRLSGALWATR